jgi:peptide/nickel transport system ATP-binding protein
LLSSIPKPDPSVNASAAQTLAGDLPSPMNPPSGCRFRTRCPRAEERCAQEEPQMRRVDGGHFVACHFPLVDVPDAPAVASDVPAEVPVALS